MLVDIIKHSKRIKEKILFHIAAPSEPNVEKEQLVLQAQDSHVKTKSGPRAAIQSLNFLTLAPKTSYEDGEYRDNLASYYFEDDRSTPIKAGIPYIALEHEEFRRHGNIRSSYPMLQGSPIELANYIWKETRGFYRNGPLGNSDGTRETDADQPKDSQDSQGSESENQLEDQEGKFNSKIYPLSAINIPIPFLENGQEIKNCINLPNEKEVAEMIKILTKESRSQITLFISGQEKEVDEYYSKVQRELAKLSLSNVTHLANINIKEGYLCSNKKPTQKDLENFKILSNLEGLQGALCEIKNFLSSNAAQYVESLVERKVKERYMKVEGDNADNADTLPNTLSSIPEEQELKALKAFIAKYEDNWSKVKKASQNNAVWYLGATASSSPRLELANREEQLDKKIAELIKYETSLIKKSKGKEPLKGSKKTKEKKEEITISFTKDELIEEMKELSLAWFNLQEDVLKSTRKCTEGMQRAPWSLKVLHVNNKSGFRRQLSWKTPISINAGNWGSKDFEKLDNELLKNQVHETHLAASEFTGKWDKENQPICKLRYPKAKEKRIINPKHFHPLPSELSTPSATELLKKDENPYSIKLDTRLSPRPELAVELLLENDNKQIELYNPVAGRPTGFKEATLWRPILTRKGIPYVENSLSEFGYKLHADPAVFNFAERKVKQAEKCLSPNYPLTPYESLAYFDYGTRTAEATVIHPETGEVLWLEGKSYHITPSWRRQTMMVDHSVEEEENTGTENSNSTSASASTSNSVSRASQIANELDENSKELAEARTNALAEDIVTLGRTDSAQRITNSARIQTLTERRINYGFATFIVEAEGNKTYEIKETVSTETISMEKERIAIEIDHLIARKEEIEAKKNRTKVENNELKKLEDQIEERTKELDSWAPMLEDFLTAFPPQAPALTTEVYDEKIRSVMKRIYSRFAPFIKNDESSDQTSLKDYQLKWAAIGAVKRGHANSSSPGSGKTIMAIMSSWEMGHHYNWVICPTIAMKTWAKELERVGLYHEIIGFDKDNSGEWVQRSGTYEHMRCLTQRFHNRQRMKNRLGKVEPEFYIISAENVCLGGEGNKTYSPWHFDYWVTTKQEKLLKALDSGDLSLPSHWAMQRSERGVMIRVWSDRGDNSKEIAKYGFKSFLRPVKFSRAHRECPQCSANAPIWTKHGYCNKCGHSHNAITRVKSSWDMAKHSPKLKGNLLNLSTRPVTGSVWQGDKVSNRQYPLYKMMGKHVGCKIIDEVHNWSNFHSQHGAALLQVKCKDTIILSGTLCKTHINELEPSLCQIYEANSGEFPYSPWGMDLFKEQFQTLEIESSYRTTSSTFEDLRQVRRSTREKVVPEASNLTKLRALLHGVMCSVGETEMERVWDIKPINESIRYVELQQDNAAIYEDWERLMKDAYAECKTEHEKVGMLRKARSQLTNLAYACDGPEKLEAAIAWIQEGMASNQRNVIVGPSTRFYTMLCRALKERKIPFMSLGNMAPEKRFDYLNKFRDSDCPNFVSRIRLVNVNFNQLTCCTRILFTGIDPSPAAIRQMQKRLNRIGQDKPVHCTFLISQLPPRFRRTSSNPHPESGLPTSDMQASLNAISLTQENLETIDQPQNLESDTYRPLSYEERLFALVLRRENAIKQTLQQADRQRDPQELYEMLKDRQTLNQLLQDIVEDTKNDTDISSLIKGMEEIPSHKKSLTDIVLSNSYQDTEETGNDVPRDMVSILGRNSLEPQDVLSGLPQLPEGFEFCWKPLQKTSTILQGELF